MTAIVYASTGGQKYHFDKQCKAFDNAQMLSDLDCGCDTYCTHRLPRMHGLQRMSSTKAAMDGKLPCLTCVPQHLREMPEAEDFGHEPIAVNQGMCGGCDTCGDAYETEICARCYTIERFRSRFTGEMSTLRNGVEWPCTSAIVLGLVHRNGVSE